VVADSSKVGQVSPSVASPIGEIDQLITDDGISDEAVSAFEASGVRVLVV
jgi:DeoR/GlpR family transcriptional regulator of sugar metabolism